MKEYALAGVRENELKLLPDERGFFAEALRQNWSGFVDEWIAQANISFSYPGIIRAWHKHIRGQLDYFMVLQGAVKICAYEETTGTMVEVVGSANNPTVIRIPGHYQHGTKTIGNEPSLTVYFVNRLYDPDNPDELRRPWDDPGIVPTEINGNKKDPRVGIPWNWSYPPYK